MEQSLECALPHPGLVQSLICGQVLLEFAPIRLQLFSAGWKCDASVYFHLPPHVVCMQGRPEGEVIMHLPSTLFTITRSLHQTELVHLAFA